MFISLTRLRVRTWWLMPAVVYYSLRSSAQAKKSAGFIEGYTLADRHRVFWTMTGWESEASMKAYRGAAAHREAMRKLPDWCDEASVYHYEGDALPTWLEAWEMIQTKGRPTPVKHPSESHVQKRIERPRTEPLVQNRIG